MKLSEVKDDFLLFAMSFISVIFNIQKNQKQQTCSVL